MAVLGAALASVAPAPAGAADEMAIDVIVRSHEAGKGARDAIRVAVSAKPGAEVAGKGTVKFGAGEHGVEISLRFEGRRGPAADRAEV